MHLRACSSDEIPKAISGPLLDRINIHIEAPRVDYEKLSGDRIGESAESIRARVPVARDLQLKRFSGWPGSSLSIPPRQTENFPCSSYSLSSRRNNITAPMNRRAASRITNIGEADRDSVCFS